MSTRPSQANMLQRLLFFFFFPSSSKWFSCKFLPIFHCLCLLSSLTSSFYKTRYSVCRKPQLCLVLYTSPALFVQTSAAWRCAVPWILCPDKLVKCTTMSSGGKKICLAWEGKCDTFLSDFLLKTIVCKKNYGTSCLHELQGSLSRARVGI